MASLSNQEPMKPRLSEGSDISTLSSFSEDSAASSTAENHKDSTNNCVQNQNIRVVTRVRPLSTKELNEQSKESVKAVESANNIQVDQSKSYTYDAVFGPETTQKQVYEQTAGDMIRSNLFKGFNVTVLAYGQTGSGKTHTIFGGNGNMVSNQLNQEVDGIIPRAVHDVFNHMNQIMCGADRMKVSMSYLEIYNEEARDLLSGDPTPPDLQIRDSGGEVVVQNLSIHGVSSPVEVASLMEAASEKRSTAATLMNATSSRSHAICTLYITIAPLPDQAENEDEITAKLTLVDLAGSERAKKTGAEGSRLKEGININKGLFVLGQVVSSLSELAQQTGGSDSSSIHVKYRDSKLTRMLQDSLGGNSKTVMVACVSPADSNTDETINTLRYAERTRSIKNSAVRNVIATPLSPAEAAALRRENQMLKLQLFQAQAKISSLSSMPAVNMPTQFAKVPLPQDTSCTSNSHDIVDNELNGLNLKDLDIVTKLKMHCSSMEEKIDQLENKNKGTVDDCLEASLTADKWRLKYEAVVNHLKHENIDIPENIALNKIDSDSFALVSELRKEIVNLKDQISDIAIDAEVSRSIAAVVVNGKGDVDNAAEAMAMVGEIEEKNEIGEDNEESKVATDAMSAELVAMSGSIEQKELMILQIQKERELMETMRSHFEGAIQSLQEEVGTLSSERDILLSRIEKDDGSKDDNQSRKLRERTKNLQLRIKELKSKASEHAKSLRLHTQAEKKCQQLQAELTADKKRRAELQRKLKKECVEHRNIQKKARLDAAKLLRDSQKLKLELSKVKEAASKQENVLRRKAAEAMHRQKLLAERTKKRMRASGSVSSDVSAQRKEEINSFVDREICNAVSLQQLYHESEENNDLLHDTEEKRDVIISQQQTTDDSALVRSLEAEIEIRSKISDQLKKNIQEIYKSANRNPSAADKNTSKFLDHKFWHGLSRCEVRYASQIIFGKLIEQQHEHESMKSKQESDVANRVSAAIALEKRDKEKQLMRLKVRQAEDITNLLQSTKTTVQNHVCEQIKNSASDDDAKERLNGMLKNYLSAYDSLGSKVQNDLNCVKAAQDGMKRLVDDMTDEMISQNEAKAMLAVQKKKKKKISNNVVVEPEDAFQSDDEKDDVHEDGDDSDWSPETPMPVKKKLRMSVESEVKSPESKIPQCDVLQEDYTKMTVVQLKELLRQNGLTVSGKKAELIQRLKFYGSSKAKEVVTASARKRPMPHADASEPATSKKSRLKSPVPSMTRKKTPRGSSNLKGVSSSRKGSSRVLTSSTKASMLRRRTPTEEDTAFLVTKRSTRPKNSTESDSNSHGTDNDNKSDASIVTSETQSTQRTAKSAKSRTAPISKGGLQSSQTFKKRVRPIAVKTALENASVSSGTLSSRSTRSANSRTTASTIGSSSTRSTTSTTRPTRSRSNARKVEKENKMSSRTRKPSRPLTVKTARSNSDSPSGKRRDQPLLSITNSAKKRRSDRRNNMARSVNVALQELEKLNDSI